MCSFRFLLQKVNNGINTNFVFPYNCSFLHYLDLYILVNVKLDVR